MKKEAVQHKVFNGTVVSAKTPQTLIVKVNRWKKNSKYLKQFVVSKRYAVHCEKAGFKEGDEVSFVSCRPLSKTKKWRVANEIK
jgi:small subunit ribosomal protein S17